MCLRRTINVTTNPITTKLTITIIIISLSYRVARKDLKIFFILLIRGDFHDLYL